ncbi:30S ribosomal protein S4e [Desulfurococcus mucosus]|uniref:Small ribosomal subunit protein eS4 n=1 Tax=Desulfurococcus mucosus (strain ATCC 35584 / DSM 2162 / JCM 9187 / O7/1) TaxID=765177 RepID=E8RAM8_DESM0|nr:30S ribosomal protein S4e [Desulfurococcus mucosus]ADV65464.1 SSU ribosomal protein S4E [Desulfurococcus mucosus DSM 2162]
MGSIGGSRHLNALNAPRYWPILRKEYKWVVKPSPGPHAIERSIPLLVLVRNVLGYAETAREARRLIAGGHFKVDGKVRKDYKFPVGLMDVIEVVETGELYRVIPVPTRVLGLVKIPREEASFKLCRIENKVTVKGGHIQLNLHDGRNLLVRVNDARNPVEDVYETLGAVKLSIPVQQLLDYIPLKEGVIAIVSGGRNVGRVGKVVSIHRGMKRYRSIVTIEDRSGNRFQTSLDYIFPIGLEKPLITLPEGAW